MNIFRCARLEAANILENEFEENRQLVYEIQKNLEKSSKYICFN